MHLTTVAQVFEAIGGRREVARITNCKPNAVGHWLALNSFAAHSYVVLNARIQSLGYTADPMLWQSPKRRAAYGLAEGQEAQG